jgi:hypothetical protein
VVTRRLSEDVRVRVGMLEAGRYVASGEEPRIDLIVNYGPVFWGLKFDWNLKSVLQEKVDGRVVQETVSRFFCRSYLFSHLPSFFASFPGKADT